MKKLSILLVLIVSFPSLAQKPKDFNMQQVYPIEASHSYVGFSVEYMGYAKVRGRFADFAGTFVYNENDLTKTSVSFSIDVASIDTDLDWRDKDLKSANWFDAEKFPRIYFASSKAVISEEGFELTGQLTIRDVTKEVILIMDKPSGVLSDMRGDSQVVFTGGLLIDRTEFGVEGKNWSRVKEGLTAVSNKVNIELSILGKQINEANFRNWVRNENRPPGMAYKMVNDAGVEATIEKFNELIAQPDSKLNSGALNIAGYMLLKEGRKEEALKILEANMQAFPEESNVYDSYAEALAKTGRIKEAVKFYKLSLEKDPENQNAKEVLRHF